MVHSFNCQTAKQLFGEIRRIFENLDDIRQRVEDSSSKRIWLKTWSIVQPNQKWFRRWWFSSNSKTSLSVKITSRSLHSGTRRWGPKKYPDNSWWSIPPGRRHEALQDSLVDTTRLKPHFQLDHTQNQWFIYSLVLKKGPQKGNSFKVEKLSNSYNAYSKWKKRARRINPKFKPKVQLPIIKIRLCRFPRESVDCQSFVACKHWF